MSAHPGSALSILARKVRRIAPGPLLMRAIAFGSGIAAIAIALPRELVHPITMLCGVAAAAVVALAPGSVLVVVVQLGTVGLWFAGTTAGSVLVTPVSLCGLAVALYLQHTACALAAAIPLDAVVLPAVFLRWCARSGPVVVGTVLLALLVFALPQWLRTPPSLLYPLLGLAAVTAITVSLAYLTFRRPHNGA